MNEYKSGDASHLIVLDFDGTIFMGDTGTLLNKGVMAPGFYERAQLWFKRDRELGIFSMRLNTDYAGHVEAMRRWFQHQVPDDLHFFDEFRLFSRLPIHFSKFISNRANFFDKDIPGAWDNFKVQAAMRDIW